MNNENTFSGIIDKVDKEFADSFKPNNKMTKDCKTCIHNRVCSHKDKNEEYKQQMEQLIEKWGESNGFGFTKDCPEWHEQPVSIKFDNGSEIKTIPCDNTTVRSRRSEEYPKYIPYEKYENTEDLFKAIMKTLFK